MNPEEIIRQELISDMVDRLGFPRELIVVERELSMLPHLQGKKVPKRRVDIVCFTKKHSLLYPLLVIECKAIPLSEKALAQVFGYNYYVGADFVAIANGHGVIMASKNGKDIKNELLFYRELSCEKSVFSV